MTDRRHVTRNVYLLGLMSFLNDVTADMITPLLPVYLGALGFGAGFLGVMEGISNAISNIATLFSGWLADRFGRAKSIMVVGYALSTFVRLLLAVPMAPVVLAARVIDRLGKGIRTAPRDQLITISTQKRYWGEAFGVQRAMDHAGALVGPAIATWLLSAYSINMTTLFLVACIPSVLSVLFVPPFIRNVPAERAGPPPVRLSWKTLPEPMKRYALISFLAAFSCPSELFLLMKMKDLGMASYHLPMAWLLMTLFSFFAAYLGGLLADRWSRRRTMALGWLLFSLVYLGFAFNGDPRLSWPLIAGYGLQLGLVEPAERAYAVRVVPESMRATALGWFYFSYGMGLLPASLIFGLVWNQLGSRPAFLLNAGITLVTVGLLRLLPSDRVPKVGV